MAKEGYSGQIEDVLCILQITPCKYRNRVKQYPGEIM
jgi:hypothetical protein